MSIVEIAKSDNDFEEVLSARIPVAASKMIAGAMERPVVPRNTRIKLKVFTVDCHVWPGDSVAFITEWSPHVLFDLNPFFFACRMSGADSVSKVVNERHSLIAISYLVVLVDDKWSAPMDWKNSSTIF